MKVCTSRPMTLEVAWMEQKECSRPDCFLCPGGPRVPPPASPLHLAFSPLIRLSLSMHVNIYTNHEKHYNFFSSFHFILFRNPAKYYFTWFLIQYAFIKRVHNPLRAVKSKSKIKLFILADSVKTQRYRYNILLMEALSLKFHCIFKYSWSR